MTFANIVSFAEQGVYDIINNLGSLVARFLFHVSANIPPVALSLGPALHARTLHPNAQPPTSQPVEENFYTFFAALLARHDGHEEHTTEEKSDHARAVDGKRVEQLKDERKTYPSPKARRRRHLPTTLDEKSRSSSNQSLAGETLTTLLKSMTFVGILMGVFGQAYAALALHLYGGEQLSQGEGPLLLRAYALYVLTMALNGMTEAFVAAVRWHRGWGGKLGGEGAFWAGEKT